MKQKTIFVGIAVLIILIFNTCTRQSDFPVLKGPYLGQKPPGMTPEVFAPGVISTEDDEELCSGFLDSGRVFVFSRLKPGEDWKKKPTYWMVMNEGVWSKPAEVPFNNLHPYNFSVAADGNTLYFSSCWSEKKPREILEEDKIWRVKYADGIWDEPEKMGPEINADSVSPNYLPLLRTELFITCLMIPIDAVKSIWSTTNG